MLSTEPKDPAFLPPVALNPPPTRHSNQLTNLHAVKHPHAAYFENINFSELSPFNKRCEELYSNITELKRLNLSKYPNLPSSDRNLIKYFQENDNALDQALNSLESSTKINLDDQTTYAKKTHLLDLIDKTDSALILLSKSLFLDHFCQTINPKSLSKIRLRQDIKELEEQEKIIQSYPKHYTAKNLFHQTKNKSKGFAVQKTNPQTTLEKFSNLKSQYFKYHFNDNNYLPYFISALETIKDPQTSLKKLQTEKQETKSSYSDKELKNKIISFIQENLEKSETFIQKEIQTAKAKLESLNANELKRKNENIKPTINPEDSFNKDAIEIGINKFYLDFLNKILTKVDYNAVEKTRESVKNEIKNEYVKYLQELVKYEQSVAKPTVSPTENFKNLEAPEIVPNLNFFPIAAPQEYSSKLLQYWEKVLQNGRVSDEDFTCLIKNERIAKELAESSRNRGLGLLDTGRNYEYLKQKGFEIRTLGNYIEDRFLIGLQTLAKNRDDLIIIVPNTVGWLNNKLKADVIILKKDQDNPENTQILAVPVFRSEVKFLII